MTRIDLLRKNYRRLCEYSWDRNVAGAILEAKVRITAARTTLQGILPKRFATRWLDLHAPQSWTNRAVEELERQIHEWIVLPAGTEGYEKAEVRC